MVKIGTCNFCNKTKELWKVHHSNGNIENEKKCIECIQKSLPPKTENGKLATMYAHSHSFGKISTRLYTQHFSNGQWKTYNESEFIHAFMGFIVNSAFFFEISFKYLLRSDNIKMKKHSLLKLFNKLSCKSKFDFYTIEQEDLFKIKDRKKFIEYLEPFDEAFVQWRYYYDDDLDFEFPFIIYRDIALISNIIISVTNEYYSNLIKLLLEEEKIST